MTTPISPDIAALLSILTLIFWAGGFYFITRLKMNDLAVEVKELREDFKSQNLIIEHKLEKQDLEINKINIQQVRMETKLDMLININGGKADKNEK